MRRPITDAYPMWIAIFFLSATFLMGGGARADIQSLAILRPLAAVCAGVALWGLSREQIASIRTSLALLALVPLIMALQLVPLPPDIWRQLPGREMYAQAASLAGIEAPWRPISLVPYRTWNSLAAWLVPMACLLLVARLNREQRYLLLPALIILGLISGLIGLIQTVGPSSGPLYFYDITNSGSAVGLFANRNHQAALLACLFPMLAAYASIDHPSIERVRLKSIFCASAALFIIPLLLVTGSRAGVVLGVIGLLAATLIYRRPRKGQFAQRTGQSPRWLYALAGGGILLLASMTIILSRARAIERLLMEDETEELRIQLLGPMWEMISVYFPAGVGFGVFPDVYKVHEPFELLSVKYVNHAHNDLLEFVLEGGLPAVAVLFIGIGAWMLGVRRLWLTGGTVDRSRVLGRLGAVIILIFGVASVVDYPLRVPSLSAVFAIATIWMVFGARRSTDGAQEARH